VSNQARSEEVRALALSAWVRAKAQGVACVQVAASFEVSPRTLRRWAKEAGEGKCMATPRGRRTRLPRRSLRQGVIALFLLLGTRVGVPTIRAMFSAVPYRQIASMKARLRKVIARRKGYRQKRLAWLAAGATWAMDFTKPKATLANGSTHLFVVRDLASGMRLAIVPCMNERARTVRKTLESLFQLHGAPLVIKHDGGSAFKAETTLALLRRFEVLSLRSPAYTPRYNGSCERGLGWAKVRIEEVAAQEGHPGRWTTRTIERARQWMNATPRPEGPQQATPCEVFEARRRVPPAARRAFKRLVASEIEAAVMTKQKLFGRMPECAELEQIERKAVQHALCEHGYLEVRRGRVSTPVWGLEADIIP